MKSWLHEFVFQFNSCAGYRSGVGKEKTNLQVLEGKFVSATHIEHDASKCVIRVVLRLRLYCFMTQLRRSPLAV